MVRHSGTRHGRREGLGVKVGIRPDPQAVLSAIGSHAVGDRLALGGKDVVHGIVRGAGNSEVVVTVIENVGLGVVGVVGGELALEDLDGELLRTQTECAPATEPVLLTVTLTVKESASSTTWKSEYPKVV